MPRTIEKTVFQFDELSDSAKDKARDWYRSGDDLFYGECTIDGAANIAELFGLDIRQTRKSRMDGTHFYAPTVYYSGFWSQGDGACFEGTYRYKSGSAKAVRAECPKDAELHRIVDELARVQKLHFYQLRASTKQRGHYYHSGCMQVEVEHAQDSYRDIGSAEEDITQALRDFADWIYRRLEAEYEYQNSNEQVDETICANEYEFTEHGERA